MTAGPYGLLTDAPATFLLVGGRVVDPTTGADAVRDLAVHDGRIADPARIPPDAERIGAEGLVVAPGFCDLHTHLRQPGTEGETVRSGTRAAARGGFTTVCAMPNTQPALDAPNLLRELANVAEREASCRIRYIAAATRGRAGDEAGDLAALKEAGAVAFSDDGASVPGEDVARDVLRRAAAVGLPLVEHAEDPALAVGAVMRAGPVATRLGLRGWPPEAELAVIERDLALARETDTRLHITHLSTAAGLDAIRRAREGGLAVTCDVTPHHLAMTDEWVAGRRAFWWDPGEESLRGAGYDSACRVNPPLASRSDAEALLRGLADGTVDAVATDHAPHPPHRKLVPFGEAAPGMIGLETALSVGLAAVEAGLVELSTLLAALSTRPATIVGERRGLECGSPADLVAFDPGARWRVEASVLASASWNTPLLGMELPGVVRLTVAEGRVTYRAEQASGPA